MIDKLTQEKIRDAANIVDVVSEFVTLRKAGINYKGLCPFHDEKTPSFVVSPTRNTCHCFGCGKGGNPVSFIMEHEQLTYPEALRWLAKKYNIEIEERELTDQERAAQSRRDSMFIVNEWAAKYFETLLHEDVDGLAIGMQYFRGRGFRDDIIRKFRLGFDLTDRHALAKKAKADGYKEQYLTDTGICYKTDRGELIDRYSGRVVFPWIDKSGKVVGFSARVLDSATKGVNQKYVNSPESEIYHKGSQLYGIFQAKHAIAKEDRVFIVEGQTDVISMHQCGIENVVANSGTALDIQQIRMLHRFTSNITLLYDGDKAGIKAAMRGTDMLLSEGMNIKVLFLPDNEDPDSFARKHTASDFRQYVEEHQTDFVQFKIDILLKNAKDPQQRSEAIDSIVQSISLIPNQILRDTYLHDSAQRIGMNEQTLISRMNTIIHERKGSTAKPEQEAAPAQPQPAQKMETRIMQIENMIAQLLVRDGEYIVQRNVPAEDGTMYDLSVAQFLYFQMQMMQLELNNPVYNRILQEAVEHRYDESFKAETYFTNHPDIEICNIANALAVDAYSMIQGGKEIKPRNSKEADQMAEQRQTQLLNMTAHLLVDLQMEHLDSRMKELQEEIKRCKDTEQLMQLMAEYRDKQQQRVEIAKEIGLNIK